MSGDAVTLSLKDARALLAAVEDAPEWRRLDRAIRRAERALTPGRWRTVHRCGRARGYRAVGIWWHAAFAYDCEDDIQPGATGWNAQAVDGTLLGSGPETGAEGRRLADRALSRWLRRQGVTWTP